MKQPDATTDYLRALMSARMGNMTDAREALQSAAGKDASYAAYGANDIELQKVNR